MPAGTPMFEFLLYDAPLAHGGKFVAVGPRRRILLEAQVDAAALEGFEHHRAVAEIVEADLFEIEASACSPARRLPQ